MRIGLSVRYVAVTFAITLQLSLPHFASGHLLYLRDGETLPTAHEPLLLSSGWGDFAHRPRTFVVTFGMRRLCTSPTDIYCYLRDWGDSARTLTDCHCTFGMGRLCTYAHGLSLYLRDGETLHVRSWTFIVPSGWAAIAFICHNYFVQTMGSVMLLFFELDNRNTKSFILG